MRKAVLLTGVMAGVLSGCGKKDPPAVPTAQVKPEAQVSSGEGSKEKTAPAEEDLLHIPFAKAVRTAEDPPAGAHRPPDTTLPGKPVFQIYEAVQKEWDNIRFKDSQGNLISYTALIETSLGEIEIELNPAWAPSHCRSFIALCRADYYTGLRFDRAHHEESEDKPPVKLDQLQAGCPLGLGEAGHGSVGYWLLPELHPDATHEEGTVGAYYDEDPDTAACRFYLNLTKAPFMDGGYTAFGKVAKGMDVARKIYSQPALAEDEGEQGSRRPAKPVVIKKVTIQVKGSVNTVSER